MINLFLIEHQELIRKGLFNLLRSQNEIQITGFAENYESALSAIDHAEFEILLLDVDLPDHDSLSLCQKINRVRPNAKVLLLSNGLKPEVLRQCHAIDIRGYVMKCITGDELIFAIRSIYLERKYYANEIVDYLSNLQPESPVAPLTSRENCILQQVAKGLNNKQVASELSISVRTVECHKRNIMNKLNISHSPELIRYALQMDMGWQLGAVQKG
jgi:DNA-binding NarL/FixJ family response regulator